MSKRFVQSLVLVLAITTSSIFAGASTLSAKFFDTSELSGSSYMNNFVESTSVEEIDDTYVVTVDLKDAYASLITKFTVEDTVSGVENISTDTNLGVYQYTVEKSEYSVGTLEYERPPLYETHSYEIYIAYQ